MPGEFAPPRGRSAISLRCIGHARPGIRARLLIKNPSAAALTLSWIQLLRRRVSVLRDTPQCGATRAATRRLTH